MFFYQDIPRLQLWFSTPNQAALFLLWFSLLFCWLLWYMFDVLKHPPLFMKLAIWSVILCLFSMLGLTYCRGGYIAMLCSLVAFCIVCRKRLCMYCLFAFILVLCILPHSIERSKSIGNFNDQAITNRVQLWKGTCGIIASHPVCGVPLSRVGLEYTSWYKPTTLREHYGSAINDILTFTASYGIVPAFFLISYIFILLINLQRAHVICKPSLVSAIALLAFLLVFSYLVIGVFNTYFMPHQGFLPFIMLIYSGSTVCIILANRIHLLKWRWKYCAYSSICSAIIIAGIVCEGCLVNQKSNYYVKFQSDVEGLNYPVIFPKSSIKGLLFFIHRVPPERIHLYHGNPFNLEWWCDELNMRVREAGNAGFCSTAVFGDNNTDFAMKIKEIAVGINKVDNNLKDKTIYLLADEDCSYDILKSINDYTQINNLVLGLQDIVISDDMEDNTGMMTSDILRNTTIATYIFTTYPIEKNDMLLSESFNPCVRIIPYSPNLNRDMRIDFISKLVELEP